MLNANNTRITRITAMTIRAMVTCSTFALDSGQCAPWSHNCLSSGATNIDTPRAGWAQVRLPHTACQFAARFLRTSCVRGRTCTLLDYLLIFVAFRCGLRRKRIRRMAARTVSAGERHDDGVAPQQAAIAGGFGALVGNRDVPGLSDCGLRQRRVQAPVGVTDVSEVVHDAVAAVGDADGDRLVGQESAARNQERAA